MLLDTLWGLSVLPTITLAQYSRMGYNGLGRVWVLCNCGGLCSGKPGRVTSGYLLILPCTEQMATHHQLVKYVATPSGPNLPAVMKNCIRISNFRRYLFSYSVVMCAPSSAEDLNQVWREELLRCGGRSQVSYLYAAWVILQ